MRGYPSRCSGARHRPWITKSRYRTACTCLSCVRFAHPQPLPKVTRLSRSCFCRARATPTGLLSDMASSLTDQLPLNGTIIALSSCYPVGIRKVIAMCHPVAFNIIFLVGTVANTTNFISTNKLPLVLVMRVFIFHKLTRSNRNIGIGFP